MVTSLRTKYKLDQLLNVYIFYLGGAFKKLALLAKKRKGACCKARKKSIKDNKKNHILGSVIHNFVPSSLSLSSLSRRDRTADPDKLYWLGLKFICLLRLSKGFKRPISGDLQTFVYFCRFKKRENEGHVYVCKMPNFSSTSLKRNINIIQKENQLW